MRIVITERKVPSQSGFSGMAISKGRIYLGTTSKLKMAW